MDVFQNLLLRKGKSQEDEIRKVAFYLNVEKLVITIWSKLLLQLTALHQVCYRPTRGNQEAGLLNWDECEFKQRLRVRRKTFNIILVHVREDIKINQKI